MKREKCNDLWRQMDRNGDGSVDEVEFMAVMQQWMSSPGHCANIMEPSYDYMGAGYLDGSVYGHTWTQTFGGSY